MGERSANKREPGKRVKEQTSERKNKRTSEQTSKRTKPCYQAFTVVRPQIRWLNFNKKKVYLASFLWG